MYIVNAEEILFPQDVSFIPAIILKAGTLTAMYESGRIRYARSNGEEVIRMIYPALRDESWNTVPANKSNEIIEYKSDSFYIEYVAEYNADAIWFQATYKITGNADGSILFYMKGEALNDFKSKRIGLCVHHPVAGCAGRDVEIRDTEGTVRHSRFPGLISPHQPFTFIKSMRWTTLQHQTVELDFEGDVFETEDQRNWTDDSFKTYSGPLDLVPMLHVRKGDVVEQTVTLRVKSMNKQGGPSFAEQSPVERRVPFPRIGFSRGINQDRLTPRMIEVLQKIPFNHYRVEISLSDPAWETLMYTAIEEAVDLKIKIELVAFFHVLSDEEIKKIADAIHGHSHMIYSILILSHLSDVTPTPFFVKAYEQLHAVFPSVKIGYGTDKNFTELNRNLPPDIPFHFLSFPVQPQVHMNDSRSILENLGSQHATIETLRPVAGEKGFHVSPITISKRPPYNTPRGEQDQYKDARLHTSLAAWWTINAISNFSEAGHLTFFEITGDRGIAGADISLNGEHLPVYTVLRRIKEFMPVYVIKDFAEGICFENKSGDRLIFRASFSKESLA